MPKTYKYYRGTKGGGPKAKETNLLRYGEDFFRRAGTLGGKVKCDKGFKVSGLGRIAGAKGGSRSRKGYKKLRDSDREGYGIYLDLATNEEKELPYGKIRDNLETWEEP